MARFATSFFGGYSKYDVDTQFTQLERRVAELEQLLAQESQNAAELQTKLYKYQDRESSINEALIDAKLIAKNIIQEAENKSEIMTAELEEIAQERLADFEESIKRVSEAENIMRRRGDHLKTELREVLKGYLAEIESIDMSGFTAIQDQVSERITAAEEMVRQSKTMITFPKMTKRNNGRDDMPTYTFDM
ncbi:DivIVA domain-containing protein [Streptococcus pluranimalium]